nr:MAG TPA: hypothetical protein [Caudoviricetes sp.]
MQCLSTGKPVVSGSAFTPAYFLFLTILTHDAFYTVHFTFQ